MTSDLKVTELMHEFETEWYRSFVESFKNNTDTVISESEVQFIW